MVAPLLAELDVAPLVEIAEAGLIHTVVLETPQTVEESGATYVTTWVPEPVQDALLTPASAGGTNIRADQPSAAGDWVLAIRAGRPINEGQRGLVKGYVDNDKQKAVAWQRLVFVTKELFPKPHELKRRALCVDADLSP